MADDKRFAVYAGPPIQEALDAVSRPDRGDYSRSGRLNTIAERYMQAVSTCMPSLSEAEWSAVLDANNGVVLDAMGVQGLHFNIEDDEGLAKRWGIDGVALSARLAAMPFAEQMAVAEVVERYWAKTKRGASVLEGLRLAGARIIEDA